MAEGLLRRARGGAFLMLKEYAVEPAAMGSSWETFRYLNELLTFERGRLISRFPNNWEGEVLAAAKASGIPTVKYHSIVERLKTAGRQGTMVGFDRKYDSTLGNWLVNAVADHKRKPFHAIIALTNAANDNDVIILDDVDNEHVLVHSTHSWEIPRTGPEISRTVAPLIRSARCILIVDPFLDWRSVVTANGYRETLGEIMRALHADGRRDVVVQLHFRTHDSRPPANLIMQNAKKLLGGLLPETFSFELYEWRERENGEDFHDRHILCDHGGLSIGAGFEAVGAHQRAEVTIKPYELTQTLRARFTIGTAAFDLVGNVIVIDAMGNANERKTK
jgi:hypothetical protein